MTRTEIDEELRRAGVDPFGASYWLKDAVNSLLTRDAVDAANDAATLADVMLYRVNRALDRKDGLTS